MAGIVEAGDCGGNVDTGFVGVAGGATHDVNANQVFAWRRRYRGAAAEPTGLRLMPVTVTPDHPVGMAPARPGKLIEVELAGGYRVCVGDGVKASTLRLVLDVLERR